MTQISFSKVYAIIDEERGKALALRKNFPKPSLNYEQFSAVLRALNTVKKRIALVSDAEQIPLGL